MCPTSKNGIHFSSLFSPAHVICQSEELGRDKILHELLRLLAYERGIGNVDQAYRAVLGRENEVPSIIGPHIAVPHVRLEGIDRIIVAAFLASDEACL